MVVVVATWKDVEESLIIVGQEGGLIEGSTGPQKAKVKAWQGQLCVAYMPYYPNFLGLCFWFIASNFLNINENDLF